MTRRAEARVPLRTSTPHLQLATLGTDTFLHARRYHLALVDQPTLPLLANGEFKLLAAVSFLTGSVLVVSSMWALGVTGTYLGDYFVRALAFLNFSPASRWNCSTPNLAPLGHY